MNPGSVTCISVSRGSVDHGHMQAVSPKAGSNSRDGKISGLRRGNPPTSLGKRDLRKPKSNYVGSYSSFMLANYELLVLSIIYRSSLMVNC